MPAFLSSVLNTKVLIIICDNKTKKLQMRWSFFPDFSCEIVLYYLTTATVCSSEDKVQHSESHLPRSIFGGMVAYCDVAVTYCDVT